jgi:hypothetical protein
MFSFSVGKRCRRALVQPCAAAAGLSKALMTSAARSSRRGAARRVTMAKGQKKSNKEARKPKAEKPKTNAAQASVKAPVGLVNLRD